MTNANHGGTSADPRGEVRDVAAMSGDAWDELKLKLIDYLAIAGSNRADNQLLIELIDPDPERDNGASPHAKFDVRGEDRTIQVWIPGNASLRPQYRIGTQAAGWFERTGWSQGTDGVDCGWQHVLPIERCEEIADGVITALRHHFGIAHPQLLTYQASGPAAAAAKRLTLCASDNVPVDEPSAPSLLASYDEQPMLGQLALEATDRDELLQFVGRLLREKYGDTPTLDEDNDYVLTHLGQPIWIRVHADQPAIEIVARVAHDVHSRRATAVEIGLLNRDNAWVRWILRDRMVWQTLLLPASPFVPRHLDAMLDNFLIAMAATRDDLAFRTGAKVA